MYRTEQSAEEFVRMFKEIFEPIQNIERDFYRIYARLIESLAACMQYINRSDYLHVAIQLPNVFSWFCSLVFKCQMEHKFNLDDIIWNKYPYVCPYCLMSTCRCHGKVNDLEVSKLTEFYNSNRNLRPVTLSQWQKMFSCIYPRYHGYNLSLNINHLYEELGEISEAYRFRYNSYKNLENEIVDALSWILGAANFLDNKAQDGDLPNYKNYDLATEVFKKYSGKCSSCKNIPCTCSISTPKISEYNQMLNWDDITAQLVQGIEELKSKIDFATKQLLSSYEAQEFIKDILIEIKKSNSNNITKEYIESFYIHNMEKPEYKKWYQKISAEGIAEGVIVNSLFMLINSFFMK